VLHQALNHQNHTKQAFLRQFAQSAPHCKCDEWLGGRLPVLNREYSVDKVRVMKF
jgi:hypothetical protein